MLTGELPAPPFARVMRMALAHVEPGRVVFEGVPDFAFLNPLGTVHGGWISTLLDSAMGCAVHSLLQSGQGYTTTSLIVHFTRALPPGEAALRCEAVAVHAGRRLMTAEGRLLDPEGRLVAHGTEACMVL
jgi:uncharacterized protein (TIGR00369 family)